jgi:hypothetical protein
MTKLKAKIKMPGLKGQGIYYYSNIAYVNFQELW